MTDPAPAPEPVRVIVSGMSFRLIDIYPISQNGYESEWRHKKITLWMNFEIGEAPTYSADVITTGVEGAWHASPEEAIEEMRRALVSERDEIDRVLSLWP